MEWALAVIALAGFGFAATATALGIHVGSQRALIGQLLTDGIELARALKEATDAHQTFKTNSTHQLEELRNEITDLEDLLEASDDPDLLRDRLASLLRKAAANPGDDSPNPDELP